MSLGDLLLPVWRAHLHATAEFFTYSNFSVHFFHNHQTPESRRLLSALVLSLLLHGLLLFFVQVAAPSWKALSSGSSQLNVTLDNPAVEETKPSAIAKAGENSLGNAKIGLQNTDITPQKSLSAVSRTPVKQFKTSLPKTSLGNEILTAKKSTQVSPAEIVPDLLVTAPPVRESPAELTKPFAPAPSVAKTVTPAPPSVASLVSTETIPGKKPEKIVFAEAVTQTTPVEKPGTGADEPAPAKIEKPEPVKVEEPKPILIEKIRPAEIIKPQPLEMEKTKPVKIEEPKPVKVPDPIPVKVSAPTPAKMTEPTPVKIDEPLPAKAGEPIIAKTEANGPQTRPGETGKSDIFRTVPSSIKIPSLAELSMASVRKFAGDEDRKIKFGERRKTVSVREQDFRYAMYVESVRLKLQRIGMFNYPAAAARDNLSGSLSVIIAIRADGSLEEFRVIQPSVYEVFNEGAERIVKMAAPFSPLPDNIRQETDILSIRINWTFSKSGQSFD